MNLASVLNHPNDTWIFAVGKKHQRLFYPFKRWTALGHWIVLGNHARMMPELANITITSKGETLDKLPTYSGVYRFFSSENTLLYIGKSIDVRARVQSHFQEGRKPVSYTHLRAHET